MSDRELLEAAARAVGLIGEAEEFWTGHSGNPNAKPFFAMYAEDGNFFNPLNNDGDAFRLAVKCRIDIEWRGDGRVSCFQHLNDDGYCYPNSCESSREDVEANTRRAIVRAAAEIGRGLSSDPSGKVE